MVALVGPIEGEVYLAAIRIGARWSTRAAVANASPLSACEVLSYLLLLPGKAIAVVREMLRTERSIRFRGLPARDAKVMLAAVRPLSALRLSFRLETRLTP